MNGRGARRGLRRIRISAARARRRPRTLPQPAAYAHDFPTTPFASESAETFAQRGLVLKEICLPGAGKSGYQSRHRLAEPRSVERATETTRSVGRHAAPDPEPAPGWSPIPLHELTVLE